MIERRGFGRSYGHYNSVAADRNSGIRIIGGGRLQILKSSRKHPEEIRQGDCKIRDFVLEYLLAWESSPATHPENLTPLIMRKTVHCAHILGLCSIGIGNAPRPADAFASAPSRQMQVLITPGLRRRDMSVPWTTENDWECRAKRRIENDDGDIDGRDATYYNDDAFGLVFLSASLVSRDFSFAGSFMLLSSIAAATVNNTSVANIKKFQPVLPGIVAFAALVTSKIEPFAAAAQLLGGDFVVPLDERGSQLQLIVCSISLVWGIIQQMRSGEGEGKF